VAFCFFLFLYRLGARHGSRADQHVKGIEMQTDQILSHLKKHGQLLDLEIASATGIALVQVRKSLADLTARGEISQCSVTHFNGDKRIDGFQCGISGYVPPAAPGRKAGPTKSVSPD